MTLRVKDGENTRYFIVSSVEARHKKYSFHGLNQICQHLRERRMPVRLTMSRRASGHHC